MDPVSLIVAALGVGVTTVGQAVVGEAVKDAYAKVKSLLIAHFQPQPKHAAALAGFEANPEGAKQTLADAVAESGASQDPALVEAARKLLAEADPDGSRAQRFSIQATNVTGVVQGNHNVVNMNFGEPGPKT